MDFNHKCTIQLVQSKWLRSVFFTGTAIAFVASTANAQETVKDDAYIESLKACQTITEDMARLGCYDVAIGKVVTASDEGQVRIISEEEVTKTKRRMFGLSLNLFGGDDDKNGDLDLLQSVITNVSFSGGNTMFITIEDGDAVWKIPNANFRTRRAKPGDSVEFKKAALGSYFIRIDGKTGVKGSRVR